MTDGTINATFGVPSGSPRTDSTHNAQEAPVMTAPRTLAPADSPVVVRTFLDPASGAHIVVTESSPGWFEARISDGHTTATVDFPKGRAGLEKLDHLMFTLGQLKPHLMI